MSNVGRFSVEDGIGIVEIDSPPVNALGIAVRRSLDESFAKAAADESVHAIVLICGGRTFFAGADISEFGKTPEEPAIHSLFDTIDAGGKPIVAAIHGTALGGGFELALLCDYRVAVPSAKVGLPEVALGLLPGAGGTQRLPRVVGPEKALEMMVGGKPVGAKQAQAMGLVDELAEEGSLRETAIAAARKLTARNRISERQDKVEGTAPELFAAFRKATARQSRGFRAPENITRAVEAAVSLPFAEGMKREHELFMELHDSTESAAQRYYFFSERETARVPDVPADTQTLAIRKVGVIGAGTMGGGITMNFLQAGIPVTLVEMNQEALDRGLGVIRRNYEISAKKGKLTAEKVEQLMGLINPVLGLEALADVDLVIEAVFEEMRIKKEIFGKLDTICRDGAILASNTSYLDIDEIAASTRRPEWVCGTHFFSPANVMRLLEVVRGRETSHQVIATAMKLAKTIGKVPVLARVCDGFIANRIMNPYMRGAQALLLEGPTPQDVDKAMFDYGFAMGPFSMLDLVGLDVIGRESTERSITGDLVKLGRLGQKKDGGFYDYDENRRATPSPVAAQVIADFAEAQGVEKGAPMSAEDIVARLLYPVVNEGAKILDEGIAIRASDIDVACILGYNWPVYTGGPMFWADTVGLPKIVEGLKALQATHGDKYKPAALLERKAAEGGSFTR